ncbi:hypothetical protein [Prescottella subtropica]|uniref:hypothetical protein n=1 Tax=Prescottella subtropica TaxID=2545757 RepID=UPI0010F9A374|nr:hypothetical protein [Prescottella subtropica]
MATSTPLDLDQVLAHVNKARAFPDGDLATTLGLLAQAHTELVASRRREHTTTGTAPDAGVLAELVEHQLRRHTLGFADAFAVSTLPATRYNSDAVAALFTRMACTPMCSGATHTRCQDKAHNAMNALGITPPDTDPEPAVVPTRR